MIYVSAALMTFAMFLVFVAGIGVGDVGQARYARTVSAFLLSAVSLVVLSMNILYYAKGVV